MGRTLIKLSLIISDLLSRPRHTIEALFFATPHVQVAASGVSCLSGSACDINILYTTPRERRHPEFRLVP